MLVLLPFAAFCSGVYLFRFAVSGLRERLLLSATGCALCMVLITEILSTSHHITQKAVALAWTIVVCLSLAGLLLARRYLRPPPYPYSREPVARKDRWLLLCCIAILATTGLTAVMAPPNGWDVTLQHMPRVMEWIAQRSVCLFPTNYYVQDFAPPFAEWCMLHLMLLPGSDRLVNLVQWLASAGSAVAVSLIARELGCKLRGQLFAALLCLTIPQGILSASGAKNDWVVAFWLAASMFFILRWQWNPRWLYTATVGVSLGLLLLTKATAYAFAPLVAVALLCITPRPAWKKLPAACMVAAAIMLLMNTAHWRQNRRLAGSIFGLPAPDVDGRLKYSADRISPATIAANLLRETSLHLGTPVDSLNRHTTQAVRGAIHALGVAPDDPALIRPGPIYAIPAYSLDEYLAGNFFHLLLAGIAFLGVAFSMRRFRREVALAAGIVAGFFFYCALFKWELWAARLHLPLFVLACAVIASYFSRSYPKAVAMFAGAVLVLAFPPLLFNSIRPLVSSNWIRAALHRPPDPQSESIFFRTRGEMYFAESSNLASSYLPAAKWARTLSCRHIGIDTTRQPFAYEYILMGIIDQGGPVRNFRYVGVRNLTSRFSSDIDRQPSCLVLCIRCQNDPDAVRQYSAAYRQARDFGNQITVFATPESARISNLFR